MTEQVVKAFNHVKQSFPQLSMVIFTSDIRGHYLDAQGYPLNFAGKDIDVSILEEAIDSINKFPCIYQPR